MAVVHTLYNGVQYWRVVATWVYSQLYNWISFSTSSRLVVKGQIEFFRSQTATIKRYNSAAVQIQHNATLIHYVHTFYVLNIPFEEHQS